MRLMGRYWRSPRQTISRREDEGEKMKMQLQKQAMTHTVGQPIEFVERSTYQNSEITSTYQFQR